MHILPGQEHPNQELANPCSGKGKEIEVDTLTGLDSENRACNSSSHKLCDYGQGT